MNHPCRLCGHKDSFDPLWTLPDYHWAFPERFNVVCCPRCRLIALNPIPERLERYYPSEYYGPPRKQQSPSYGWRLAEIERHIKSGRILDVGCGNGGFLRFLKDRGWEVSGLDNSPAAVEIARQSLGSPVFLGSLKEARYPSDHFDVVSLFEVLEHLPDPLSDLREIRRMLKPGGVLVLSVPNYSSWERILFQRWWNGLDIPRHLHQFTPETLQAILQKADFKLLGLRSVNACDIQTNRSRISYCQESLRFFLRDCGLYPPPPPPPNSEEAASPRIGVQAVPSLLKQAIHFAENLIFHPFCRLNRLLDKDNSLWASAQKPKA